MSDVDKILIALARNNLPVLRKLVNKGNVNACDEDGFSLLMNAAMDDETVPEAVQLFFWTVGPMSLSPTSRDTRLCTSLPATTGRRLSACFWRRAGTFTRSIPGATRPSIIASSANAI